jgi:hypothetical protein
MKEIRNRSNNGAKNGSPVLFSMKRMRRKGTFGLDIIQVAF